MYMELDRLSFQLMSFVHTYVRVCLCTCVHALDRIEVSAPGSPLYWPAGLVANCEQQN